MWVKIRNLVVPIVLNESALRAMCGIAGLTTEKSNSVASAVMSIKYYVDTKDKRYINQCIDTLQSLI